VAAQNLVMMMFSAAAAAFRARGTHVEQFGLPRDSKKMHRGTSQLLLKRQL
jgi:hypothetical protein